MALLPLPGKGIFKFYFISWAQFFRLHFSNNLFNSFKFSQLLAGRLLKYPLIMFLSY